MAASMEFIWKKIVNNKDINQNCYESAHPPRIKSLKLLKVIEVTNLLAENES